MAVRDVTIRPQAGSPSVEIRFGYANVAGYRLYEFDENAQNRKPIGDGTNTDARPDIFALGDSAEDMDGHYLTVDAAITTPVVQPSGPTNRYSVSLHVSQGAEEVSGSPIVYEGELDDGAFLFRQSLRFHVG